MNYTEVLNEYNELLRKNTENKSHDIESKIITLLEKFLKEGSPTNEQITWAFWNISDNYALQRKSLEQYNNHRLFEGHLSKMNKEYSWMLTCDATQRYTLILGGYEKYHNELYIRNVKETPVNESNYIVAFHSHSTMIHHPTILVVKYENEVAPIAINKMVEMIEEYKDDSQILWMKLKYYCTLLDYNKYNNINSDKIVQESLETFELLRPYLLQKELIEHKYPFGTLEEWNEKMNMYCQARSINNYIISLIDSGYYNIANESYSKIPNDEFRNKYFLNKIKLMKSKL